MSEEKEETITPTKLTVSWKKPKSKQEWSKSLPDVLEMEETTTITDEANFIFDLGADSIQSLALVAGFEEEFDIEMDEDKALEVQTVGHAVEFIAEYL
jgi:acyl carrier protein